MNTAHSITINRSKPSPRLISSFSTSINSFSPQFCEACGLDDGFLHEGMYFRYKTIVCLHCTQTPPTIPPTESGTDFPLPHKPYPLDVFELVTRYTNVTKTTAQKEYLLNDKDLEAIPHFLAKNPHSISYSSMKLYLLAHVAALSSMKYDSLAKMQQLKDTREYTRLDTQIKLRVQKEREQLLVQQCYEKGYDQNMTYMKLFAEQMRFKTLLKNEHKLKRHELKQQQLEQQQQHDDDIRNKNDFENEQEHNNDNLEDGNENDYLNSLFNLSDYENDDIDGQSMPSLLSNSKSIPVTTGQRQISPKPQTSRYQQEIDLISSWFDPLPPSVPPTNFPSTILPTNNLDDDLAVLLSSDDELSSLPSSSLKFDSRNQKLNPKSKSTSKLSSKSIPKSTKRNLISLSSSSNDDSSDSNLSDHEVAAYKTTSKHIKRQKISSASKSKPTSAPTDFPSSNQSTKSPKATKSKTTKSSTKPRSREAIHTHEFVFKDGYEVCKCGAEIEVESFF